MEDIVNGQANLRNALTSCDDPLKAIEAFQVSKFQLFKKKKSKNINDQIVYSFGMASPSSLYGRCCLY